LPALERAGRLAPQSNQGRDDVDFWLGATRIVLKQPLAGLQSLESLLARSPKHLDALDLAARTYADLASALWNDIAERHFETAAGYEVHGHALEAEGNLMGALEAYRRSKAMNRKRPGPGLAIGRLLLHLGKREEALSALNEELVLTPGDGELRELLLAAQRLTVSPP
jgi:tetratricopeptide (TPR) repeat protein